MRRTLLVLALAGTGPLLAAAPALAAGSGSVTTRPAAEAWYRTSPACALPIGCPPTSSYPEDTLHVGVQAGTEESRTYLRLDLTVLPVGTKPAGGELRLPLASSDDGTFRPEAATLKACLVSDAVAEADGTTPEELPDTDCKSAEVPAKFVAAAGAAPAAFTVDLADLASSWTSAAAPGGLALLPGAVTPADTWHLAFSGKDRSGAGVTKPTAAVSYVGAAVDVEEAPPPFVQAPVEPAPIAPAGTVALPESGFAAAPGVAAPAPAPAPQAPPELPRAQVPAQTQAITPVALVDGSFRYPAVFLVPLVLAGAAGWLGRAMTRDLDSLG